MRNAAQKCSGYRGQQLVLSTYCHGWWLHFCSTACTPCRLLPVHHNSCLRSIAVLHPSQCSKAVHTLSSSKWGATYSCSGQNLSPLTWSVSHLVWCLLPITDLEWPKMAMSHAPRRLFLRNLHISDLSWTVIALVKYNYLLFLYG